MALELIAGAAFSVLYDLVSRAVDKKVAFKASLRAMKRTLESLRGQAGIIREIGELNVELSLRHDTIDDLKTQMIEGTKLISRLSDRGIFTYCCKNGCAEQLDELNKSLEELLASLWLQQARDVKEILKLSRQNHDDHEEMKQLVKKLLLQNGRELVEETSAAETSTENEGNGDKQVGSLGGGLEAALLSLFGVVLEVKDKNVMYRPLLGSIKSTLECLKPLIEDMEQGNRVLNRPVKELECFRMHLGKGVELVRKCSKNGVFAKCKKKKYTNRLLELDACLQGQLNVLRVQVATDVRETTASIRSMQKMTKQIAESAVLTNQIEMNGPCEVAEPSSPDEQNAGLVEISSPDVHNEGLVSVNEMVPVDVAASAVGLALSVLFKWVVDELARNYMYEKAKEFKPLLEKIKIKLEALQPAIEEIEQKNQELDRPDELKDFSKVIEDGKALFDKLKEKARWYKKPKYTNKLKELDESLHTQMMLLGVRSASEVANLSVIANITEGNTTNIRMQIGNMSMQMGSLSTQMNNMDMQMGDMGMQIGNLTTTQDNLVEMVKDMKRNGPVQNKAKVGCFGVPEPPPFTVGFEMHLDELKKKLVDDGKSMALITGHPGSGKTTLAISFCQDKKVKDKFSSIIFVDVSKRPNTEVVQEICEKDGTPIPCFQTEEIALQRLQQLLNKKGQDPVLLVLDNVWPGNRTDSLLESFRTKESEVSNYKILVTSSYELPGFDVVRHVDELNDKDALSVLRYSARLAISSFIPEELQIKVVECCKRLPLAIEVVGRSLFGKDIVIWKDRVEAWSSGSSVISSEKQLRDCLQSSLDALGEENADIKECFMDLASFPQGRRIPASVLIDMWTVLIDRWAADKDSSCFAKLYELNYWSLANLVITRNEKGEMDDYYGEHYLTQHDLLRELAIHQTNEGPREQRKRLIVDICGNKFPKWWRKQMDQPFNEARLVSISTDSHFSSKWRDIQLPKAKVLVLNFHTENYGLPEFVEKMEILKVLIVTNHGFLPAEVSNFSLLGSLSKLKRIRLERISFCSLTKNLIQLKRLRKISFFMCDMGLAFSKGSINFKEAFPELQEINIDYCSDLVQLPPDICDLIHLKKLSITNCHKLSALPEMIGELINLELLRLRSCTDLSEFPGSVRELKKLKVLDISNCYSIKELPDCIGEMCSIEKLNMRQCSRLDELPESILDLENLTEVICDEETKGLWEPYLTLGNNIKIRVVKEEISLDWL